MVLFPCYTHMLDIKQLNLCSKNEKGKREERERERNGHRPYCVSIERKNKIEIQHSQ